MRRARRGLIGSQGGRASSGADFSAIEDLQLIDVSLVAKTDQGLVEVPGLGLAFDRIGMTVRKSSGEEVSVLPWPILRRLAADADHVEGYGTAPRADLEVESDRRRHHFLVSYVDPGALSGALSSLSTRYVGHDLVMSEHRGRRTRM